MTRHQRRKQARKRSLAKAIKLASVIRKNDVAAKAAANLSQPYRGKRTPSGLVSSIYSGAANPMGYTRNGLQRGSRKETCVNARGLRVAKEY